MKKRKKLILKKKDDIFVRVAKTAFMRKYDAKTGKFGERVSFYDLFWKKRRQL